MQPVLVLLASARGHCAKGFLNSLRHLSRYGGADSFPFEFLDRYNFHSCAGKKCFVSREQIIQHKGSDFDLDAQIVRDFNSRVTCDPEKNRMPRVIRDEPTAANKEEILSGAFRDAFICVKQQRFIIASALSILDGQDRVNVLAAGLCGGGYHLRIKFPPW